MIMSERVMGEHGCPAFQSGVAGLGLIGNILVEERSSGRLK